MFLILSLSLSIFLFAVYNIIKLFFIQINEYNTYIYDLQFQFCSSLSNRSLPWQYKFSKVAEKTYFDFIIFFFSNVKLFFFYFMSKWSLNISIRENNLNFFIQSTTTKKIRIKWHQAKKKKYFIISFKKNWRRKASNKKRFI